MSNNYDVAIIGAGVGGVFAAYQLCETKAKVCLIDFGRPPNKRRKQLEGWLGCFPNSNARLYLNSNEIKNVCGTRRTNSATKIVKDVFEQYCPMKKVRTRSPLDSAKNKLQKYNYSLLINDYIQLKSNNIHSFSKGMANKIIDSNIDLFFDTEVFSITKENNIFIIETENGKISAKNIIFGAGRSGWRFSDKIYKSFGLQKDNDFAYFGFKIEMQSHLLKEWNHSHCTLYNDDIIIGPLSWKGTVIQEDHCDLAISSWRSNEERWKSEKVSFSLIFKDKFLNNGFEQTERLGKLAYILSDNRVGKIKVKDLIDGINDVCKVPEYENIINKIQDVENIIPHITTKGMLYMPDILTYKNTINLHKNLSTDLEGFYAVGESAGFYGIYNAALSGTIAAKNIG